jgi:hypothetical protein
MGRTNQSEWRYQAKNVFHIITLEETGGGGEERTEDILFRAKSGTEVTLADYSLDYSFDRYIIHWTIESRIWQLPRFTFQFISYSCGWNY